MEVVRKSIGLDLDTCLNDLEVRWLSDYNRDYNDNITAEDLLTWETWRYVKPECGKKIYDYLKTPGYFRGLNPKPYTQKVTKWLVKYFDVYIVTAYHAETCLDKKNFMVENYPWIPEENIMFVNDKSKVFLDYLVDDGPHNVLVFRGQSILLDMAYNRYLGDAYPRIKDYRGVKTYFNNVLKEQDLLKLQA